MKKKDQAEPDSKRRRKSTRTDSHDRDGEISSTPTKTTATVVRQSDEKTSHPAATKRSPKLSIIKSDLKPRDLSEISVMQIEEKEASERNSSEDVQLYVETCTEIQKLMSEANKLKTEGKEYSSKEIIERRIKATLLTTSLKKLNRLSLIRGKKAREKTQELKQKVDVLHLDLQNLLYEVMHMKKEIRKCTEFTSKDEDIDLVDVETFYEEAPIDVSKPDLTKENHHIQMLARLEWELQQRKKLAEMKDQLGKKKEEMQKDITDKTNTIDGLLPSLEEILKATLPVQEKMGLYIDATKAQHETATFLPKPLYVFYVQACAFRDSADHKMFINIDGDVQGAKACLDREKLDVDGYEDSDVEDNNETGDKEDNKRRKHKKDKEKARLEEHRRSVLRKHPLTVNVKINCISKIVVNMQFSYLPALHIVTIATSLEFLESNASPVLTSSSLLASDTIFNNLFPGDDGGSSPNSSNQYQLKSLGLDEFSSYIPLLGRPYFWVQKVCGLHYLPNTPNQNLTVDSNISSQNIEVIIKTIKTRIISRLALQEQLASLETLILPAIKDPDNLFPTLILTRIYDWKCITYSDYKELSFTSDFVEAGLVKNSDNFYAATLKREKEVIEAAIVIAEDYPHHPPLFALKFFPNKLSGQVNSIREIECELNARFADFTEYQPDMLLSKMLRRLMVCFDVFCETGEPGVKQERLFIKPRRGRDRIRPYHYYSEKGVFIHQ
eukprot:gene14140-15617_t